MCSYMKNEPCSPVRCNLVPRACDPWEGNEGSGIIRCRKPGILAKIELRIHFNGQSDSSLKRIIPEPSFPSQGSQARGTRLGEVRSHLALGGILVKWAKIFHMKALSRAGRRARTAVRRVQAYAPGRIFDFQLSETRFPAFRG